MIKTLHVCYLDWYTTPHFLTPYARDNWCKEKMIAIQQQLRERACSILVRKGTSIAFKAKRMLTVTGKQDTICFFCELELTYKGLTQSEAAKAELYWAA